MSFDVELSLREHGADPAMLEVLHRQVRDELGQLDNVDISARRHPRVADPFAIAAEETTEPLGTRGIDAATVNAVAVTVLGSGGLTAMVASARAWLGREQNHQRTVRLTLADDVLELSGATTDEQQQLIELFLSRHEMREG